MEAMRIHGVVVRIEPALDFGFIRDEGNGDWFFVGAGVRGGPQALRVGAHVTFEYEDTFQGPRATDIVVERVA